jgi:hypothetical protein
MDSVSGRSILIVASLQAAIALVALTSSPTAAIAAAAIGLLAVGRYAAIVLFTATLGSGPKSRFRALSGFAWALGFAALIVAVAVVALRARSSLPWAAAAAFVGPLGLSLLAFCSGIRALSAGRSGQAENTGSERSEGQGTSCP